MKILLLVLLVISLPVLAKEKIRLSTGEWAPYVSEKLEHFGLFTQITTEAFATQGIEVEYGFFPWQRVFQLSREGDWDGTVAYAKTDEREKFYIYSEPLYTGKYVLFHLKNHPFKWSKYEDLKSIRIAATRGFGGMGQEFISAETKKIISVERLADDTQSFNMLLLNRVQAVASDMDVGYTLINKIFDAKTSALFGHNEKIIQYAKYHLVMPKNLNKSAGLIVKFNSGLAAMKKSGRYDQLIKEFNYRNVMPKDPKARLAFSKIYLE